MSSKPPIVCKLTGVIGAPAKAHIIPECFYQFDKENRKRAKIVKVADNPRWSSSPVGEYGSGIVTNEGESRFLDWDDYACRFLVQRRCQEPELLHSPVDFASCACFVDKLF
jgi:hypothetical protein